MGAGCHAHDGGTQNIRYATIAERICQSTRNVWRLHDFKLALLATVPLPKKIPNLYWKAVPKSAHPAHLVGGLSHIKTRFIQFSDNEHISNGGGREPVTMQIALPSAACLLLYYDACAREKV